MTRARIRAALRDSKGLDGERVGWAETVGVGVFLVLWFVGAILI